MSDRVLVIEDDPEVAAFERTLLERAGFDVVAAAADADDVLEPPPNESDLDA